MFNQQPNTPFGGGGGGPFGQQQQQQPAFGSPAAAPAGGGLFGGGGGGFGAQQPAAQPTFGGGVGGGFGGTPAPAAGSLFGNPPAPSGSLFGGGGGGFGAQPVPAPQTTFGAPAPAAGSSLFGGAPAAPSTSPFGAPPQTGGASFGGGGFGTATTAASTASPFGAAPSSTFGAAPSTTFASAPTSNLFGAAPTPAPQTSFGGVPTGGAFGGTSGGFGAATTPVGAFAGAPTAGTRAAPYQVTNKQDGTTSINLQSIAAMQPYQDKSHEELRFEDYSQGNKGTTPAAAGGFAGGGGAFAAAPPAAPGLGSSTGGSLFGGTPQPAPFGAPAPAPTSGGLFGSVTPAPASGGFGGGGFGSTAFGATPAPAPGSGLFGSSSAPAPFGAAPTPAGGLFGSTPAPAPGGGFGGGGFGSAAFGATPAPAPGAGLFGPTPAPAPFGAAPGPTGGLFGGTPAPAPGGGFGGGGFGSTFGSTPAPAPFGAAPGPAGGLFGSTPAQAPGAFGPTPAPAQPPGGAQLQPLFAPNVLIVGQEANEVMEQKLLAMDNQRKELEKMEVWRGGSPSRSPATTPTSLHDPQSFFSPPTAARAYSHTPRSSAKIKPRGFPRTEIAKKSPHALIHARLDNSSMMSPEAYARTSRNVLTIRPDSLKSRPRFALQLDGPKAPDFPTENLDPVPPEDEEQEQVVEATDVPAPAAGPTPSPREMSEARTTPSVSSTRVEPSTTPGHEYYQQVIGNSDGSPLNTEAPATNGSPHTEPSCVPKLTKSGYEVQPSLDNLSAMSEAELACVSNFSVKRPGYGMVQWEGSVDTRGIDLDRVVVIDKKDVSVYTQDEEEGTKPEEGTKLNRPARITFYGIFPKGGAKASAEEKERFSRKVEHTTQKNGAEFISYDISTGVWKIRVLHFSRYGLLDDESDEENLPEKNVQLPPESTPLRPKKLVAQRKATPHPRSRIAFTDIDESESTLQNEVSDVEMDEADLAAAVVMETERAAKAIYESSKIPQERDEAHPNKSNVVFEGYQDDGVDFTEQLLVTAGAVTVSLDDVESIETLGSKSSLCGRFMKRKPSANGAMHQRQVGRPMAACWLPNGSFLELQTSGVSASTTLVQGFPILQGMSGPDTELLELQRSSSLRIASGKDGCPLFSLGKRSEVATHRFAGETPLLQSLAEVDTRHDDAKHAFLLLSHLFESEMAETTMAKDQTPLSARNLYAVYKLLVAICSPDATPGETETASKVFEALSAGNVEAACMLAADGGFLHLSVALSAFAEGKKDIMQLLVGTANSRDLSRLREPTVSRILEGASCDMESENALYERGDQSLDWRRRLVLRILQDPDKSLNQVLEQYQIDVAAHRVPFPRPRFLEESADEIEDLFFRLCRFCAEPTTTKVRDIVDPRGHTRLIHDFGLSFHLASAMSYAVEPTALTPIEAEYILNGYEAQLTTDGYWEWAVFVALCSLTDATEEVLRWKVDRAKKTVIQNYRGDDSADSASRRDFLERQVGIPSKWFEEALAYRKAARGDLLHCLSHAFRVNEKFAFSSFAALVLPTIFFDSEHDPSQWIELFAYTAPSDILAVQMQVYFALENRFDLIGQGMELPEQREYWADLCSLEKGLSDLRVRGKQIVPESTEFLLFPAQDELLSSMICEALVRVRVLKRDVSQLIQEQLPPEEL